MDAEIKKQWIEALRSGKYKQGQQALCRLVRDEQGQVVDKLFCCLGVLCDIVAPSQWVYPAEGEVATINEAGNADAGVEPRRNTGMPTNEVFEVSGLHREDAYMLTRANDREDKTFEEIATLIEGSI